MKTAALGRAFQAGLSPLACGVSCLVDPQTRAQAQSSGDNKAQEATLDYVEVKYPATSWGIGISPESQAFRKEPPAVSQKVFRGTLVFPGSADSSMCFVWDYRGGKLYLDLNRNRDLSDDLNGVFSTTVSRLNNYAQTFSDVRLHLKTALGDSPACFDLILYNPETHLFANATCRSLWQGKISLGGKDWQVGRIEGAGPAGKQSGGLLLLREWEQREKAFNAQNGSLDAFPFPEHLFFGGKAYEVKSEMLTQEGQLKCKVTFREESAVQAEVNVTGQFIRRLVMTPVSTAAGRTAYTVVLDGPSGPVKVPPAIYHQVGVEVKAGDKSAYRLVPTMLEVPETGKTPAFTAGGPLTNSVSTGRRGRDLSISYQLLGADGAPYMMADQDRSHPPRFTISKGGKELQSGAFEYG